jgi:ABC-type branched-subunit amino acid transport system substrate-binding protein
VSQGEVKVGNVSTMSGPVPGFGQTGVAGVRAYFNMVNATGGVCGRKLTLLTGDDRLQAASNRSETEKLSDQVLAFVGNTTVTDDGGTPVIDGKKIPDVSLSISEARIRSAFNFSPNPIDLDGVGSGVAPVLQHMAKTYGISRAAIIYPEQASAKARALEYRQDFEKAGIEVVEEFSVAVTETNFSSQVNTMKNSDVDIVITALEVNGMARLAQAFDQARWFPKVPFYGAQVYGKKFLELAGSAANGTIVGFSFAIPEDRGSNQAVAKLHEWYTKSNPGLDFDFFAIMGWIAADMFVTALRSTGPNPTRESLHAELSKFTAYQGGGIVGTINPAQKKPAQCFMVAKVANGSWQREFPGQGFQC